MEISTLAIKYLKRKAKRTGDEETVLQSELIDIQTRLQLNYNEGDKMKMDKL